MFKNFKKKEKRKMKEIIRTVKHQVIYASEVKVVDGGLVENALMPIKVKANTMTEERALKECRKAFGKNKTLIVKNIEEEITKYACPLDVFMANTRVVENDETVEGEE